MSLAETISARGTCPRRAVGAIIVVNNNMVAFGYNGSPRKIAHCCDVGCTIEHGHCVSAVHAENNAIIKFDTTRYWNDYSTLYTTASPCRSCMNMIINANINKIVYRDQYVSDTHQSNKAQWSFDVAKQCNIEMVWIGDCK